MPRRAGLRLRLRLRQASARTADIVLLIKDETVTIALNVGAIRESPLQKCLIFISNDYKGHYLLQLHKELV